MKFNSWLENSMIHFIWVLSFFTDKSQVDETWFMKNYCLKKMREEETCFIEDQGREDLEFVTEILQQQAAVCSLKDRLWGSLKSLILPAQRLCCDYKMLWRGSQANRSMVSLKRFGRKRIYKVNSNLKLQNKTNTWNYLDRIKLY